VRTVIAMAHGLRMKVVAEGVETEEQSAFLVRRRCDESQGYLFGRPMAMKDVVEHIQANGPKQEACEVPPEAVLELAAGVGA